MLTWWLSLFCLWEMERWPSPILNYDGEEYFPLNKVTN